MTVEALAQEIHRIKGGAEPDAVGFAETLLTFIAAGQQGAGDEMIQHMARRFLCWKLPDDFSPDAGISIDRGYCEKWRTWPAGTNLFTADQATVMMRFVLENAVAGAPPAQQPLDDSANNAGVAAGSRNESPSESVTRGSPQLHTQPPKPAGAVPAWFGELPAPISNPEAWPANYAGGYNDALNMCYDVIRGHAPQPMTTQGEAVYLVQHKDTTVKSNWTELTKDSYEGGCFPDELFRRRELYTGSQP